MDSDPINKPAGKWQRRAEQRPDEIMDAALTLFMDKGFSATKVDQIARRAGVSKGAVYLYFRSKEDILESLVRRAIVPTANAAVAMAAEASGDPRPTLRTLINIFSELFADPNVVAIPRLVITEAATIPSLAKMYQTEVVMPGMKGVERLIQNGIDCGVFRDVDAQLATRNVIGPILANSLLKNVFGIGEPTPHKFIASHFDILINGLTPSAEN